MVCRLGGNEKLPKLHMCGVISDMEDSIERFLLSVRTLLDRAYCRPSQVPSDDEDNPLELLMHTWRVPRAGCRLSGSDLRTTGA